MGVGLHLNAECTSQQVEVVDVGRADIDLQRVEHIRQVNAEELRLVAVNIEIELRRLCLEQREHLHQTRRLRRAAHHRIDRALQRLRAAAVAVLDHHAKATGVADAVHRRRLHDDHEGFLQRP